MQKNISSLQNFRWNNKEYAQTIRLLSRNIFFMLHNLSFDFTLLATDFTKHYQIVYA